MCDQPWKEGQFFEYGDDMLVDLMKSFTPDSFKSSSRRRVDVRGSSSLDTHQETNLRS
ncbi:hypothetical protein Scep_025256 [Stephania cephalantha]|uniref:Uncharacterized protein n=1 Tax=Stephania cephalantha TaxID=152367 RepID=A0AAP0EL95_9MAGN